MELIVNGRRAYAYTGGKPFDATLPCVVFIHGALHDHSVWTLLARWFAHHGHGVLAVDQPAHGRSEGPPLADVQALADWTLALLDAAGVRPAVLVGHSFGALAACRLIQTQKVNIAGIVMVAPAEPSLFELDEAVLPERLRVPSLLFASRNDPLMTFKRAQYWAECWGGRLIDLGDAGHINAESGFGDWNYGLEQLAEFCEGLPQFIKT